VAGPSPRQVVLAGERETLLRGRGVQPVSLLPHRNDWDELTRDTVRAVEWGIGSRAFHRPGDVIEVPGSIGYFQFLLRKTGARRRGRDYARTVLAKAQEIGLLSDTGRVLKPRRQPRGEHQYWWRVWSVVPLKHALSSLPRLPNGTYCGNGNPRGAVHPTGSLCRFLSRQGLIWSPRRRSRPNPGSAQWAFMHTGPP
jgi:hypothetical protein